MIPVILAMDEKRTELYAVTTENGGLESKKFYALSVDYTKIAL